MGADDPAMMNRIYNNDNFKKSLIAWLPFLFEKGYLDMLVTKKENGEVHKEE